MHAARSCSGILLAFVLGAASVGAAHAQEECAASVEDEDVGEVTVIVTPGRNGRADQLEMFWIPGRGDFVDGRYVVKPGLMLDYKFDRAGAVTGPVAAHVLISKVSNSQDGAGDRGPALSEVRVKVTAGGADVAAWDSAGAVRGGEKLAKFLREAAPDELRVALVDRRDAELSHAVFNLQHMDRVTGMGREARAQAERACGG